MGWKYPDRQYDEYAEQLDRKVHGSVDRLSIEVEESGGNKPGCCCRWMAVDMIGWKDVGVG